MTGEIAEIIVFETKDFHSLLALQQWLHSRERALSFDEQRDFAEKLRLAIGQGLTVADWRYLIDPAN